MKSFKTMLAAAALGLVALTTHSFAEDKGLIGISMPTKSSARWIADGDNMVKVFTEKGYTTDLQYADDDIPNQLAQIENMVTKGVKVLVIAAIDGHYYVGPDNGLFAYVAADGPVADLDHLVRASVASAETHDVKLAVSLRRLAAFGVLTPDEALQTGLARLAAGQLL